MKKVILNDMRNLICVLLLTGCGTTNYIAADLPPAERAFAECDMQVPKGNDPLFDLFGRKRALATCMRSKGFVADK